MHPPSRPQYLGPLEDPREYGVKYLHKPGRYGPHPLPTAEGIIDLAWALHATLLDADEVSETLGFVHERRARRHPAGYDEYTRAGAWGVSQLCMAADGEPVGKL